MAEKITNGVDHVLREMFCGQDAALRKYAKVRATQYEIGLWWRYGLPMSQVSSVAKKYFSQRFLGGLKIREAEESQIRAGLTRLDHAVRDGCRVRCVRLVEELNVEFGKLGLEPVKDIDKFLDWLTFSYTVPLDYDGRPCMEKPYGFEIRVFRNAQNLDEFWKKLQSFLRKGKMLSMRDVCRIVLIERRAVQTNKGE